MKEVKPVEYFCFCPFNQYFGIEVEEIVRYKCEYKICIYI